MVQNIPVYNITIDLNDEETMMTCISLVRDPAVERDFECFDKAKQPMKFAITDAGKHCITGVAIRANALIYRYSYTMGEYYVRFTPQTIEDIVFKYSKMGLWNSVSLEHSGENITDAVMVEYFIKGNGKDPQGFEDVEEGSLFVTYKITNDELWETIKNSNEINGFSIEILADLEPTDEVVEEEAEEDEYEMNNWLAELLSWLADEDDYSDKKKAKFKRITKGDVQDAMSKNRKVNITIGEQTLWEQQITSIGIDRNGNRIVVVYDPQHNDWETYKIHDITEIQVTEAECENLTYNSKWETITNDPMLEIDVTLPSLGIGKDTFEWCMDRNAYCMIEYNDETEDPATGFRTCIITSWGYTQKSKGNGNECLRVYEVSGDTKTGFEDGRYRFILTRRIRSFRAVDYVEPSLQAPPLYNGERQQGSGKRGTMSIVKRTATFPALKRLDE